VKILNHSTELVPLNRLKPHPKNPRQGDVGAIHVSIEANGFYGSVIAQKSTGHILAGNHRFLAAQHANAEEIPVTWVDVSDAEAERILLADNRTNDLATYDDQALAEMLEGLLRDTGSLAGTGYDGDDLDELLADIARANHVDTEIPEKPVHATTQPGDIWILGRHRILCGDSTKPADVERLLDGASFDVVVLDPPFEMADKLWISWINDPSIVFGQARHIRRIPDKLWRFERIVVKRYRHRSATTQVDHRHAFVAQVGSIKKLPDSKETFPSVIEQEAEREHDHAKPVSLIMEHLTQWTPPWNTVMDPFLGSGSTLIAAEKLGRTCYGIEMDPAYCDVIVARWEALTNAKACKESDYA